MDAIFIMAIGQKVIVTLRSHRVHAACDTSSKELLHRS